MRDLLLVTASSFGLGLLLLGWLFDLPRDVVLSAFWFVVLIPLAGALLVGLLGPKAPARSQPGWADGGH